MKAAYSSYHVIRVGKSPGFWFKSLAKSGWSWWKPKTTASNMFEEYEVLTKQNVTVLSVPVLRRCNPWIVPCRLITPAILTSRCPRSLQTAASFYLNYNSRQFDIRSLKGKTKFRKGRSIMEGQGKSLGWYREHVHTLLKALRWALMFSVARLNWKRSRIKHGVLERQAYFSVLLWSRTNGERLINFIEPLFSGRQITIMRSNAQCRETRARFSEWWRGFFISC